MSFELIVSELDAVGVVVEADEALLRDEAGPAHSRRPSSLVLECYRARECVTATLTHTHRHTQSIDPPLVAHSHSLTPRHCPRRHHSITLTPLQAAQQTPAGTLQPTADTPSPRACPAQSLTPPGEPLTRSPALANPHLVPRRTRLGLLAYRQHTALRRATPHPSVVAVPSLSLPRRTLGPPVSLSFPPHNPIDPRRPPLRLDA
ncbi:hypothetical protein AAT19DRAFT_14243 [Rhodotorula toruloides]|uniref:Uncharacterized protein n=1 Tax=Rhodotorula toruloides TaxID=5286 RepID=A0A2T0AB33_RHOTO|nr:hypothetical protein AAT19DRAFT_14243 [Rhodotorula toruloides]